MAFPRHREGVLESNNNKSFFSGKEQRHSIYHPLEGEFITNLFLVEKKDEGNQPLINLKHLNQFIPYQHFKMDGLHSPLNILRKVDYMSKLDLKD